MAIQEIEKIKFNKKGTLITFIKNWDKISQFFYLKRFTAINFYGII
jgi:hypothetical protein